MRAISNRRKQQSVRRITYEGDFSNCREESIVRKITYEGDDSNLCSLRIRRVGEGAKHERTASSPADEDPPLPRGAF